MGKELTKQHVDYIVLVIMYWLRSDRGDYVSAI